MGRTSEMPASVRATIRYAVPAKPRSSIPPTERAPTGRPRSIPSRSAMSGRRPRDCRSAAEVHAPPRAHSRARFPRCPGSSQRLLSGNRGSRRPPPGRREGSGVRRSGAQRFNRRRRWQRPAYGAHVDYGERTVRSPRTICSALRKPVLAAKKVRPDERLAAHSHRVPAPLALCDGSSVRRSSSTTAKFTAAGTIRTVHVVRIHFELRTAASLVLRPADRARGGPGLQAL